LQQRLLLSPRASLTPLLVEISGEVSEAELTRRIRRLAAEVEARHPEGGDVLVVGPAVVETGLAEHVFDDLHRLVPFAVGVIVLGLLVVCRRPIFLCLAVVHSLVLLAVVLGAMAACGVSVNLVSVLAPVILIPIGVADLLHLFIRLDSVTPPGGDHHRNRFSGLSDLSRGGDPAVRPDPVGRSHRRPGRHPDPRCGAPGAFLATAQARANLDTPDD